MAGCFKSFNVLRLGVTVRFSGVCFFEGYLLDFKVPGSDELASAIWLEEYLDEAEICWSGIGRVAGGGEHFEFAELRARPEAGRH